MECAETVLRADPASASAYRALVQQQMSAIFESCTFQDITGQRIANVISRLQQLETELTRIAAGETDARAKHAGAPKRASARAPFPVLHGPQPEGQGNSQADIDALFCGATEPGI